MTGDLYFSSCFVTFNREVHRLLQIKITQTNSCNI